MRKGPLGAEFHSELGIQGGSPHSKCKLNNTQVIHPTRVRKVNGILNGYTETSIRVQNGPFPQILSHKLVATDQRRK